MRSPVHPILGLLLVNVGITIYSLPAGNILVAVLFGMVLPGGFLVCLGQTLRSRVADINLGIFPRTELPICYWLAVCGMSGAYLFASAALLAIKKGGS